MCGIAGIYLKDPNIVASEDDRAMFDRFVDALLLNIESRGRDSTGFLAVNGSKIQLDKKAVPASDFIKTRRRAWLKGGTRIVLGHTRFATQGHQSVNENNHPVMFERTFIVHNGHINNDDEVFSELALERPDKTKVDSVAIAAALQKHGFRDLVPALKLLKGSYAVAAVNPTQYPNELVLIKGPSSPLNWLETKHMLVWASTGSAIKDAMKDILGTDIPFKDVNYLGEGDVIHVKDGEIEVHKDFFEPTKTYRYSSYSGGEGWHGGWHGGSYTPTRPTTPTTKPRGVTVVLNLTDRIAALRADGDGKAITIDNKHEMSSAQKAMHRGRWMKCIHCQDWIAEFHIIDNPRWGEICIDCLSIALNASQKLPEKPANDPLAYAKMGSDDYDFLLEYAEFEWELLHETLEALSLRTGLEKEMIFFLVYGSDGESLDKAAEEFRERVQEDFLAMEKSILFGSFTQNETEEAGETCPVEEHEALGPERQLGAGPAANGLGKCDHCRRKAKMMLNQHKWCQMHLSKCHMKRCKGDPVAFDSDGKRWCHTHSRSRKGLTYVPKVVTTT